jgi:histidinol-phosphatase
LDLDLDLVLDVARRAATAGAAAALVHFRTDLVIETKPDRSPVTAADRAAEAAILETIRSTFPEHSILTEESGAHAGTPQTRWIVDPLDGTRGFSRGGTHWGPLVALEHRGEVLAGAMALPAAGTTYWAARGKGCHRDGVRQEVSKVADIRDATLMLGEVGALLAPPAGAGVADLVSRAASTRSFGDLAGVAALLEGRADVWLEAGVRIWDIAPVVILVEEAGGRFTDFDGHVSIEGGRAIATNGLLHDAVLAALGR